MSDVLHWCRELGLVGHVSAMTVAHGGIDMYHDKASKLGPDPLREDADKEVRWHICLLLYRHSGSTHTVWGCVHVHHVVLVR